MHKSRFEERILEARTARRGRSSVPFFVFLKKLYVAERLVNRTHSKIHDPQLLRESKGQFVVSCITAMEVYFREMMRKAIDEKLLDVPRLPGAKEPRFSYTELEWIKKKAVSIGEIICHDYNFQNLHEINEAFEIVIGDNFVKSLRSYRYDCPNHGEEQIRKDFYERVQSLMKLRHSFVHEVNFKFNLSLLEIRDMVDALFHFVDFADALLYGYFDKHR